MADRLVSVDDNFDFPTAVAQRQAARLGDASTPEGAALAGAYARPAPNSAVTLGDSITYHAALVTSVQVANRDRGYWNWANARMGRRFTLLKNAGIGGERTDQILSRVDTDVLALNPGWCFELSGTNDMIQNVPLATAKANRLAIWRKILGAGIKLVVGTIPPFSTATATAAQQSFIAEFNAWVRAQAAILPLIVVDYYSVLVSPAGTGWAGGTTDNDGIHPDRTGCAAMGRLLADAVAPLTAPHDTLISSNADVNILVNGMMTGSANGVATGWGLEKLTGAVQPTGAKVPRMDGKPGEWQQITVAPGGASGGASLYKLSGPASPGQRVYADCEVEMDSNVGAFQFLTLRLFASPGGLTKLTPYAADFEPYAVSVSVPTPNRLEKGILRTPVITLPATTTHCIIQIEYKGEGTIRVGRASIRLAP